MASIPKSFKTSDGMIKRQYDTQKNYNKIKYSKRQYNTKQYKYEYYYSRISPEEIQAKRGEQRYLTQRLKGEYTGTCYLQARVGVVPFDADASMQAFHQTTPYLLLTPLPPETRATSTSHPSCVVIIRLNNSIII